MHFVYKILYLDQKKEHHQGISFRFSSLWMECYRKIQKEKFYSISYLLDMDIMKDVSCQILK